MLKPFPQLNSYPLVEFPPKKDFLVEMALVILLERNWKALKKLIGLKVVSEKIGFTNQPSLMTMEGTVMLFMHVSAG